MSDVCISVFLCVSGTVFQYHSLTAEKRIIKRVLNKSVAESKIIPRTVLFCDA